MKCSSGKWFFALCCVVAAVGTVFSTSPASAEHASIEVVGHPTKIQKVTRTSSHELLYAQITVHVVDHGDNFLKFFCDRNSVACDLWIMEVCPPSNQPATLHHQEFPDGTTSETWTCDPVLTGGTEARCTVFSGYLISPPGYDLAVPVLNDVALARRQTPCTL